MPTEADDSTKSVALALQRVFHDLQFLDKVCDAQLRLSVYSTAINIRLQSYCYENSKICFIIKYVFRLLAQKS